MTVFQNQTLVNFKLYVGEEITGQTSCEILWKKPDGTTGVWTPDTVYEDYPGARLEYEVQSGDLDQHGTWEFQAKAVLPTGDVYGEIVKYQIYQPIV